MTVDENIAYLTTIIGAFSLISLIVNPLNDDKWNMVVKGVLLWGWIRRVKNTTSFIVNAYTECHR